jgi:hypothetical protein
MGDVFGEEIGRHARSSLGGWIVLVVYWWAILLYLYLLLFVCWLSYLYLWLVCICV